MKNSRLLGMIIALGLILEAAWFLPAFSSSSRSGLEVAPLKPSTSPNLPIFGQNPRILLYRHTFSYSSPGNSIIISSLGPVPSEGQLDYFTDERSVQFFDPKDGSVLKTLASVRTYSVDLPEDSDFAKAARDYPWTYSSHFGTTAMTALAKRHFFYKADERDGIRYITTTYNYLNSTRKNLIVQLALRLSHPYHKDQSDMFRVEFAGREKRIKESQWRSSLSNDGIQDASGFVDSFVQDLLSSAEKLK